MDYDLVVVGGGTGGLSAAREATRLGASTLLVEHGRLGGDCTFTGCVPSKALLAAAARGESFSDAMATVHEAVETIAATEDDDALKRQGVEVLHGWATFRSPQEIDVDGRRIRSSRFVVATGAGPAVPPIEGLRKLRHLTNENVFELDHLPRRLAVLGGGAIGAEMSQAFVRLGSEVTIAEAEDRILTKEEPEASAVVTEAFREEGITIRVGAKSPRSAPSSAATEQPSSTSTAALRSRPTGYSSPSAGDRQQPGSGSKTSASPWTSGASSAPTTLWRRRCRASGRSAT